MKAVAYLSGHYMVHLGSVEAIDEALVPVDFDNKTVRPRQRNERIEWLVVRDDEVNLTEEGRAEVIEREAKREANQYRDWWLEDRKRVGDLEKERNELKARLEALESTCPHKGVESGEEVKS